MRAAWIALSAFVLAETVFASAAYAQQPSFVGRAPAPGSVGLLVTSNATTASQLAGELQAAGCQVESLGVLRAGSWSTYVSGAPGAVNATFPTSLTASSPFFVRCSSSLPSTARPTPAPTVTRTAVPTPPPTSVAPPPPPPAGGGGLTLTSIDGRAFLLASDGTYLGVVSSNRFMGDSICNQFGKYGNPFSSLSVRNEFAPYGNPFSSKSAYNEFTSSPPAIVLGERIVGYLTKNTVLAGGVDPDLLFAIYGCTE